ncbi:MAG: hypothetical protein INR64_19350 [Caulobacteraceae bacterium]|nr:hypothetical protein [Caulobacter sp.]
MELTATEGGDPVTAPASELVEATAPPPPAELPPAAGIAEPAAVIDTEEPSGAPQAAEAEPAFVAEPEVVQAVSAPDVEPTPPEPDPNEISGAPAAPRRGWWRRRG